MRGLHNAREFGRVKEGKGRRGKVGRETVEVRGEIKSSEAMR